MSFERQLPPAARPAASHLLSPHLGLRYHPSPFFNQTMQYIMVSSDQYHVRHLNGVVWWTTGNTYKITF